MTKSDSLDGVYEAYEAAERRYLELLSGRAVDSERTEGARVVAQTARDWYEAALDHHRGLRASGASEDELRSADQQEDATEMLWELWDDIAEAYEGRLPPQDVG
jgi:hypothetical protein